MWVTILIPIIHRLFWQVVMTTTMFWISRKELFAKVAEVTEKESGRTMEVYTDLPGMQLYSGNFIENEKGKDGQTYTKREPVSALKRSFSRTPSMLSPYTMRD